MKTLFLLRHFKSSWDFPQLEDFDRPLATRGVRAGQLVAQHMAERGVRPALVLCSAARRTRQTLDFLLEQLDGVPVRYERGLYTFDAGPLLTRLRDLGDDVGDVLLVGHNPALETLVAQLATSDPADAAMTRLSQKYPTGGLAELTTQARSWKAVKEGGFRLASFVRPRDLE